MRSCSMHGCVWDTDGWLVVWAGLICIWESHMFYDIINSTDVCLRPKIHFLKAFKRGIFKSPDMWLIVELNTNTKCKSWTPTAKHHGTYHQIPWLPAIFKHGWLSSRLHMWAALSLSAGHHQGQWKWRTMLPPSVATEHPLTSRESGAISGSRVTISSAARPIKTIQNVCWFIGSMPRLISLFQSAREDGKIISFGLHYATLFY